MSLPNKPLVGPSAKSKELFGNPAFGAAPVFPNTKVLTYRPSMAELVVEGATVKCNCSVEKRTLKGSGITTLKVGSKAALSVKDTKLLEKNFAICDKLTEKERKKTGSLVSQIKCSPDFEDEWEGGDDATTINGAAALHKFCTLKCKKAGGLVKILKTGQGEISDDDEKLLDQLLRDSIKELNLPKEAQDYWLETMKKELKNGKYSSDEWSKIIEETKQNLLFDDNGNILQIATADLGTGTGIIVTKNGKYDVELTKQANKEYDAEKWEQNKDAWLTMLSGIGKLGLSALILGGDVAITTGSAGGTALIGVTEAVGAASVATAGSGALDIGKGISKLGGGNLTIEYSFARGYDDFRNLRDPKDFDNFHDSNDIGGTERMNNNPQNGNMPRNNQKQNEQVDEVSKLLELTADEREKLHYSIQGRGYGFQEIFEVAKDMFRK